MNLIYIIQPVFAMGVLTVLMFLWMYVTRLSAVRRLKIHPQEGQDTDDLKALLPKEVNRVSNNYNHLFEQPTLFYAVCLSLAVLNHVDYVHVVCAWFFVAIRVMHSLVQATIDVVIVRLILFVLSWLVLSVMIIRGALSVF